MQARAAQVQAAHGQWAITQAEYEANKQQIRLPLATNHRLLLEDEPDRLALELADGPWELERPALVARVGNQRFARVCAFLFPDEDTRARAVSFPP